jgi:hypothetical protein
MDSRGLLFIPDISGFTRFVTDMEIEHSRHIIQELLEVLIDSNEIGLEISEIEGDAILFYKFGQSPDLKKLFEQVEKMFCSFHRHLLSYEHRRICQCKACNTANRLTLKVITHYGEFTGYNVKKFSKLIGKDVIVAHQLLKNDIGQHEYWLVTKDVLGNQSPDKFQEWIRWEAMSKATENGEISFLYTQLSDLKSKIEPEPLPDFGIAKKLKVLSVSKEFDIDIKRLIYTAIHFEFRHEWVDGVKGIDNVSEFLPGVGTSHRCILEKGFVTMYTSDFLYDPESKIVYSETDEKKQVTTFFILEKMGEQKTKFTIELHLRDSFPLKVIFQLFMKNKMERSFQKSIDNLEGVARKVEIPVEF